MSFPLSKFLWFAAAACLAVALSGCGGGGGGGGSSMPATSMMPGDGATMMPGNGASIMPGDGASMMPGDGGSMDSGSCEIGATLSAGQSCSHESTGSMFTFTVRDDGTGCVGGVCSGSGVTINNFSARKNASGQWEIVALPGEDVTMGDGGGTTPPIRTQEDTVVAAALNEPRAGSVTQSSDGGDDNVTRDVVKVTITRSGNSLNVDASYNGQKVVSTTDATEVFQDTSNGGFPKGTRLFERVVGGGNEYGIEFYRSLAAGDVLEQDGTAVPAGQLWVDVYTDYGANGDTDYLSLGMWVYVPDGATNLDHYEYGAFADGNDPFSQNNLVSLSGTARYVGQATGVYAVKAIRTNYFFDAAATLTADFGADSTLGTIEGRVHDFEVDGVPISGNPQLTLGGANIGNSNSGFFKGNTSTTFAGDTFTGKWGGQFYSNGEPDGNPGSVAGTFGAAATDGSKGFLGAFGAYKEEMGRPVLQQR